MIRNSRPVGILVVGTGVVLLTIFLANPAMTDDGDDAKDGQQRRHGHHHMSADSIFERMDADGSESVSKEEFENAFNKMRDRMRRYREGRHRHGHHQARGSHGRRGDKDGRRARCGSQHGGHKCSHCRRGGGNVVHVHHHHYYAGSPQERHHGHRGHWRGRRHGSKRDGGGWRKDRHRSHHHRDHGRKHGERSDSAFQLDNHFDDVDSESQDVELSEDFDATFSEDDGFAFLDGSDESLVEEEAEFLLSEAEGEDESSSSSVDVEELQFEDNEVEEVDDSVDLGE